MRYFIKLKKKSYTFSLINSKIKRRLFFRTQPRASLAQCQCTCICSRTDIKISSFHEKIVGTKIVRRCETSHVLYHALIYHGSFHSLSPSLARSFFAPCISLSFRRCKGAGVAVVYEYSRSLRQWNDERHPRLPSPCPDAEPAPFAGGFLPKRRASRSISSRGFSMRTVPSVP